MIDGDDEAPITPETSAGVRGISRGVGFWGPKIRFPGLGVAPISTNTGLSRFASAGLGFSAHLGVGSLYRQQNFLGDAMARVAETNRIATPLAMPRSLNSFLLQLPDYSSFTRLPSESLLGLTTWLDDFAKSLTRLVPDISALTSGALPDNIVEAAIDFDVEVLKQLMLDEGLPLAWVPNANILKAVFAADTAAQRRSIYGRRWRGIVTDCESLLERVTSAEVAPFASYAQKAVVGLRDGHHELAQAFAATTLDSFLMTVSERRELTTASREAIDEFPIRYFFIACQLTGIHTRFFPRDGDEIPSTFNRHGSIHGVSRRQYSRLNAVLGLAHLTSALWWAESIYSRRRS